MTYAHGLGGGSDLPIPANFAILGGTAALVVSFAVLLLAWRRSVLEDGSRRVLVPERLAAVLDGAAFAITLRVLGMLVFGFTAFAAIAGPDLLSNPTFGVFYVWLWVGIVPASLLFGRFYRAISPARTLHLVVARLTGSDPGRGVLELPRWVGYWPAAVGLFAFVWLELVYPLSTYLGPVRLWFVLYLAAMLVGGALFGDRWLERADPFEVYSTLLAHLSVWGRDDQGRLVVTTPLRNLTRIEPAPGLVATVAVLLGSTAWDSYRESPTWVRFSQTISMPTLVDTGMLLGFAVLVGAVFALATGLLPGDVEERRLVPQRMAHSVVPIVVGYMVAHYLTFFVEVGQRTLAQMSDPLVTGANLFGTADLQINYWLSNHPTFLATVKVLAIVLGHVVGVIAAHDRALKLLPTRLHVTGQLGLLAVMVLYTFGGLYLLFGA